MPVITLTIISKTTSNGNKDDTRVMVILQMLYNSAIMAMFHQILHNYGYPSHQNPLDHKAIIMVHFFIRPSVTNMTRVSRS